ncbi:hypothetical protein MJ579_08935 [Klebsiella pneumoniae]|nr:hypothetical protein MJ579_08935 [Klebsiella pneumoniae]
MFLLATATIWPLLGIGRQCGQHFTGLVALLVCLIRPPSRRAAVGHRRRRDEPYARANVVIATNGRAVETAGDVDVPVAG